MTEAWRARPTRIAAHYLGYRAWYLLLPALGGRRGAAALAMVWGYAAARLRRRSGHEEEAHAYLHCNGAREPEAPGFEAAGRRNQPELR